MMWTKITLLAIVETIYCLANFNIDKLVRSADLEISGCIKSVIQKNFPCGTLITLVDSKDDGELVQYLNNETNCYSFIVRSYDDRDWYISTPMYVIKAENLSEFSTGLLTVTNDLFWNPRGQFIINLNTLKKDDVDKLFKILLNHKTYDAVLIRKSQDDVFIDTFSSVSNNVLCGKKVEVITIGNCKNDAHLSFPSHEMTLKNCTMKIAVAEDIPNIIFEKSNYTDNGKPILGLEQFVLETIAEREGAQLQYILADPIKSLGLGVVLPNNTATGLLAYLQKPDVDIAGGGFILIKNRNVLFDYIWGINYAEYKVFTPALGEEIWKDASKVFSINTWIMIVAVYCLFTVIGTAARKLRPKRHPDQMCMSLKLWGYFYMNTSSRLSTDKRFRIIMVFWVWFTFFVSSFYNTALYSLLTDRDQIKREISVDRLHELPYEPCISTSTRAFFRFAYNQSLPTGPNIPECENSQSALDYAATQKRFYAIELENIYELNVNKYTDDEGNPLLDRWSFSITNILSMYVSRGFPWIHEFQRYIFQMYASGLLNHQLNKIYGAKNHASEPQKIVNYEEMVLPDLRIHFCILVLGSLMSMVCLLLEILWDRHSQVLRAKWKKLRTHRTMQRSIAITGKYKDIHMRRYFERHNRKQ